VKNLFAPVLACTILAAAFVFVLPSHFLASASTADNEQMGDQIAQQFVPGYQIVQGEYVDPRIAFSLPDGLTGYLWKSPGDGQYMTIQIHPGFNSTQASDCCPTIDNAPAVMLFDSGPMDSVSSVPFAGEIFAAVQGYNMKMGIERLNGADVLAASLSAKDREGTGKHVGKFYIMSDGSDRFVSYGLWADEQRYSEYLDEFEQSARSIRIENATAIDLKLLFGPYFASVPDLMVDNGNLTATLHPELISPSGIEGLALDSTSLTVSIDGSSQDQEFLILNTGELLSGPHVVAVDGEPANGTILRSGSQEFLFVVYDKEGPHKVTITGTAVVPEFPLPALFALAAVGAVVIAGRMRIIKWPKAC
jgi:hypothetical protein